MNNRVTYTLSNGQRGWMETVTGEVVDQTRNVRTEVTQSAPTMLSKDLVIPGRVSSHKVVEQELWIRTPDGKEESHQVGHLDLSVRQGHVVTLLWGGPESLNNGWYYACHNHSTGQVTSNVLSIGTALRRWKLRFGSGAMALKGMVTGAPIAAVCALFYTSGSMSSKLDYAVIFGILGAIGGLFLGCTVGQQLGPNQRAARLVGDIDEAARRHLRTVAAP